MPQGDTTDPRSISDVVDGLDELAESAEVVRVADVLDKFGNRSFSPVMLVLALLVLTPIGVVPGVPTFFAACIMLVAVQLLFGAEHIWIPDWVARRSVTGTKLGAAVEKLDGIAARLDKIARGRLNHLARGAALRIAALLIILLCICVPPLEVLPWACVGPMLAIAILSLAIMVRDGLIMLIAWTLSIGAASGLAVWYFNSGYAGSGFFPLEFTDRAIALLAVLF